MHGELDHLLANEHVADLRRAAERQRFARFAKQDSSVARVMACLRRRERPISHRAPARLGDAEPTTGVTDAAAVKA